MQKKHFLAVSLLTAVLLSGCSTPTQYLPSFLTPYRPDLHQGNVVTAEMIDSLHEGMTRNQVLFLLGSPMLKSTFHKDTWDYIYYLNRRNGDIQERKLVVVFNDEGRVEKFEADKMPNETDADLMILGERARESTLKQAVDHSSEKEPEAPQTAPAL